MTIPDLAAGRPIPDTEDLRLLAELINNVSIPLANAAWNARMSQAEAALRLVSMAERGLPLRLVADGDRQALWHIAQAGPTTSGVPVTGAAEPAAGPEAPVTMAPPPASHGVPPPMPPVPPHEQAIAGAVPLGGPPFGPPDQATHSDAADSGTPPAGSDPSAVPPQAASAVAPPSGPAAAADPDPGALWGPAGSASWARADDDPGGPRAGEGPGLSAPDAAPDAPDAAGPSAAGPAAPRWATQRVQGPGGEQVDVTILDVLDPGDRVLTDAGFRMDPGRRAVLVHSSVANTGQQHYYPVGDLYLVLETEEHVLLGKDNVAVATHPAYPVGVPPGRTADGWSVFLIPSETVLAGIKWCIRPDIPQTIVGWPLTP